MRRAAIVGTAFFALAPRVPMWIAPQLFAQHAHGQSVYVYR